MKNKRILCRLKKSNRYSILDKLVVVFSMKLQQLLFSMNNHHRIFSHNFDNDVFVVLLKKIHDISYKHEHLRPLTIDVELIYHVETKRIGKINMALCNHFICTWRA